MRVVALDTTGREGSVALVEGQRVVAERRGDASRTHAERLPTEILTLLESGGVDLTEIDLFAVAAGPGSFTGLRIGIATIQGLAFVHGRRVAAVSALEALVHAADGGLRPGALVGAWMDAQRGEVFTALYRVAVAPPFAAERLIELESPSVCEPVRALVQWSSLIANEPVLFVGDGATAYRSVIGSRVPAAEIMAPPPLAGTIGLMGVSMAASDQAVDPAAVRPLYVRRPDAEIARDKRVHAAKEEPQPERRR